MEAQVKASLKQLRLRLATFCIACYRFDSERKFARKSMHVFYHPVRVCVICMGLLT